MPNDIPHLEAYTASQFQRRTGCTQENAEGYNCERFGRTNALATILSAKTRPEGCSEVRWRIELRRRAQQKELGKFYCGVSRH